MVYSGMDSTLLSIGTAQEALGPIGVQHAEILEEGDSLTYYTPLATEEAGDGAWAERMQQLGMRLTPKGESLHGKIRNAHLQHVRTVLPMPEAREVKSLPPTAANNPIVAFMVLTGFISFLYIFVSRRRLMWQTLKDYFFLKVRNFNVGTSSSMTMFTFSSLWLFVTSAGTLVYYLISLYSMQEGAFGTVLLPLLCYGGAVLLVVFRHLTINYLGYVFANGGSAVELYRKVFFTALFGMGVLLFPVSLLTVYGPHSLYEVNVIAGVTVLILYGILLIVQTSKMFLHSLTSLLIIVLYLCTLEFLPLLVLAKSIIAD